MIDSPTPGPRLPHRKRLRFSPQLGMSSLSNTEMSTELEELKKENALLNDELQQLREEADSLEASTEEPVDMPSLVKERTTLQHTLTALQQELKLVQAETQKLRQKNGDSRDIKIPTTEDLAHELGILKREEQALTEQVKRAVSARKTELKAQTNERLQVITSEIETTEQNVKTLAETIDQMKIMRGDVNLSPKAPRLSDISPRKVQSIKDRISSVNREIITLEDKCHTLKRFVAMRSPERMRKIVVECEFMDSYLSLPRM